jgi:hypothetical protein
MTIKTGDTVGNPRYYIMGTFIFITYINYIFHFFRRNLNSRKLKVFLVLRGSTAAKNVRRKEEGNVLNRRHLRRKMPSRKCQEDFKSCIKTAVMILSIKCSCCLNRMSLFYIIICGATLSPTKWGISCWLFGVKMSFVSYNKCQHLLKQGFSQHFMFPF